MEQTHHWLAHRPCEVCQVYVFDDGSFNEKGTGQVVMFRGEPLKRVKGQLPPCRLQIGCPKGTPENSKALSEKNRQAYEHYHECRAVGQFPDDPIVRQNAAIIRGVEDRMQGK